MEVTEPDGWLAYGIVVIVLALLVAFLGPPRLRIGALVVLAIGVGVVLLSVLSMDDSCDGVGQDRPANCGLR